MKRTLPLIPIIFLLLLVLSTCEEAILRDDCADLEDVELTLFAEFWTDCAPEDFLPAAGAGFRIIRGNDTLFTGNLDGNGQFRTGPIENSRCGMNNVTIEAVYRGKSVRETFGVLCCDTILSYVFSDIACDEPVPFTCESLDTIIHKSIVTTGECIALNAPFDALRNNNVLLWAAERISIDLTELFALRGRIFLESLIPEPSATNVILEAGERLEIYFNVDRSSSDTIIPVVLSLPTACIDSAGNKVSTGAVTLALDATICDPEVCYCPFGENDTPKTHYAPEKVAVGNSRTFDFTLLELSPGSLSENCLLQIDSIRRMDGRPAAVKSNNEAWAIQKHNQEEALMSTGDFLSVDALFAPPLGGSYTEDFTVFASVVSPLNPGNAILCSFRFRLSGEGCEVLCPEIKVLALGASLPGNVPFLPGSSKILSDDEPIAQMLEGIMSTTCFDALEQNGSALYLLSPGSSVSCSEIRIEIQRETLGVYDDRQFFQADLSSPTLSDRQPVSLLINFNPPDLAQHYNAQHDGTYRCRIRLRALTGETELCSQVFDVSATVHEFSLDSRDVIPMEAFSQVSAWASEPSYHVYDIDQFNVLLRNYGIRESLTRSFVDLSVDPHKPLTDHSLYFDVDTPLDSLVNFTQKPKLYLVNTAGNNFSMVTTEALAQYSSADDFFAAYESGELMQTVFNGIDPDALNWSRVRHKTAFSSLGGISLEPGGVYAIWDPEGTTESFFINLGKVRIYCSLALIYVSSVKSGQDTTDPETGGNGKASVSFYVQYPIQYINGSL